MMQDVCYDISGVYTLWINETSASRWYIIMNPTTGQGIMTKLLNNTNKQSNPTYKIWNYANTKNQFTTDAWSMNKWDTSKPMGTYNSTSKTIYWDAIPHRFLFIWDGPQKTIRSLQPSAVDITPNNQVTEILETIKKVNAYVCGVDYIGWLQTIESQRKTDLSCAAMLELHPPILMTGIDPLLYVMFTRIYQTFINLLCPDVNGKVQVKLLYTMIYNMQAAYCKK